MKKEMKIFATFLAIFLVAYFLPLATPQFAEGTNPTSAKVTSAIIEAFVLLQWYARNHTAYILYVGRVLDVLRGPIPVGVCPLPQCRFHLAPPLGFT